MTAICGACGRVVDVIDVAPAVNGAKPVTCKFCPVCDRLVPRPEAATAHLSQHG